VVGGGASPELVADTVLATLKGVFAESWGVRVEQVLSAALVTLARLPGATLVDLPLLLTNAAYRQRLIAASGADPLGTGQFWAAYEALSEAQRQQWVGPVLTRLQPFLIRPHLRATLGQATPSFDLGEVFTRRRIVLVSLNKGVLGAESARLLGSLLVGQLWPLILARAAVEPSRRHVVSVFIDEVQDYLSLPGSLADALAQARSLGAAFHLAHQYRGQLPAALKAGIDANTRNKIIFSLSAADAAELARQAIDLEAADFQLLPRFGVYARTLHHGRENPWCQATTLPPTPPTQDAPAPRAARRSTMRTALGTASTTTPASAPLTRRTAPWTRPTTSRMMSGSTRNSSRTYATREGPAFLITACVLRNGCTPSSRRATAASTIAATSTPLRRGACAPALSMAS